MGWYSAGEQTNPVDGAVLADTGKILTGNNVPMYVIVSAMVNCKVIIEHRDEPNTGAVVNQGLRCLANDTVVVPIGYIVLDLGERIRVVTSGVIVGAIQASINY